MHVSALLVLLHTASAQVKYTCVQHVLLPSDNEGDVVHAFICMTMYYGCSTLLGKAVAATS